MVMTVVQGMPCVSFDLSSDFSAAGRLQTALYTTMALVMAPLVGPLLSCNLTRRSGLVVMVFDC